MKTMIKTYIPRTGDVTAQWWLIDAQDLVLGRLATKIATLLRGKHKPEFTPHLDLGDYVVVVNAEKVAVTGNRMTEKMYYRYSGYPGGLAEETLSDLLKRQPDRVIRLAVRGMLPRNRLGRQMLDKLKVYPGLEHPHQGQAPQALDMAAWPRVQAQE
jgi:large subunit ribosomal protein L13